MKKQTSAKNGRVWNDPVDSRYRDIMRAATHTPFVAISISCERSSSAGYPPVTQKRESLSRTKAIAGFLTP